MSTWHKKYTLLIEQRDLGTCADFGDSEGEEVAYSLSLCVSLLFSPSPFSVFLLFFSPLSLPQQLSFVP